MSRKKMVKLMSRGQKNRVMKRITAKQKAARRKNIAIARKHRKRVGKGKGSVEKGVARAIGFDKKVSVVRGKGSKSRKRTYKSAFKKSYQGSKGKGSKMDRVIRAHEIAYQKVTGRPRQLTSRIKWF